MSDRRASRVVADGPDRIHNENRDRISSEVRAKYAGELSTARGWARLRLRWRMRSEIRRALNDLAPPSALYTARGRHKQASASGDDSAR